MMVKSDFLRYYVDILLVNWNFISTIVVLYSRICILPYRKLYFGEGYIVNKITAEIKKITWLQGLNNTLVLGLDVLLYKFKSGYKYDD